MTEVKNLNKVNGNGMKVEQSRTVEKVSDNQNGTGGKQYVRYTEPVSGRK